MWQHGLGWGCTGTTGPTTPAAGTQRTLPNMETLQKVPWADGSRSKGQQIDLPSNQL